MSSSAQTNDRIRQVVVMVLAVVAIAGAFIGSGALGGTPIQDAAGGALAADATLIAPAGPAFSIWSVIYAGLLGYAVWQLLPTQATRDVHRRVGYLVALSMVLNALWIGAIQLDQLGLSVLVIVVLLGVLGILLHRLVSAPAQRASRGTRVVDAVVLHGTVGLYLGWVTIATAANITAWLVAIGFDGFGVEPDVWGVAVVIVAGAIGIATALAGRGRLTPAISLAWGLVWLAVARLTDEPRSVAVGAAAVITAIVVLLVAAARKLVAARS